MTPERLVIPERFAFIGFGEAASVFAQGWRTVADVKITAFDIKTDDAGTRDAKLADFEKFDVIGVNTAFEAVTDADVVFSAVTAEAAAGAANSVAAALKPGSLYLDINSAAPSRKRAAEEAVARSGVDYVDVAVMSPVHPALHQSPLLISGPGAKRAEDLMRQLDMRFETISDKVGDASTIKMIRSVMIKGLEALVSESIVAAVHSGIDEKILASLDATFPGMDWTKRAGYMLERMVRHGKRRAEEMREVATTMDDLGVGGVMSAAIAERQQRVADLALLDIFEGAPPEDHKILARAILDAEKGQGT